MAGATYIGSDPKYKGRRADVVAKDYRTLLVQFDTGTHEEMYGRIPWEILDWRIDPDFRSMRWPKCEREGQNGFSD